ncbi:hypothetical protein PVL30_004194 [Lodderomyces elongisporus]|uniref:uncharacterized protein n=1 Tax=Lodderomyces elongisporus TaxID=36914 RepID=UPI0029205A67|nr:uncharacterized protein PVL30_004194 [Lodderomyces elongisporus]WLF80417.1 hypothetical protein PVL30_004194 [Lodderomyces elongisporus]
MLYFPTITWLVLVFCSKFLQADLISSTTSKSFVTVENKQEVNSQSPTGLLSSYQSFSPSLKKEHDYENDYEVDDDTILETLKRSRYSLIYFYSDSCKYCLQFNPTFENLQSLYSSTEEKELQILKSNGRLNKKLSQLFSVPHYPTIKLLNYKTSEIKTFDEKRDLSKLVDFIVRETKINPDFSVLDSPFLKTFNNVDTLLASDTDSVLILTMSYLHDWKDVDYPTHFIQHVARDHSDINFYVLKTDVMEDFDIAEKFGVSGFPSLIYLRNKQFKGLHTDAESFKSNGYLDEQKIRRFIESIKNGEETNSGWRDYKERVRSSLNQSEHEYEVDHNDEDDDDYEIEHIEL